MPDSIFCEKHTALIYDRGGMNRLYALIEISEIQWERDRDGISEAHVYIDGASCAKQWDVLQAIQCKRHELVIFRGDDRVWEGPIFRIADEGDQVKIFAKDIAAYLEATMLSKVWDNTYNSQAGITEVTTRLDGIIRHELVTSRTGRAQGGGTALIEAWESLDPPANIIDFFQVHHFPSEARTAAYTQKFEMTVGEHLSSMARTSGVDYTVVGRALHIWDTSRSIGEIRTLTESDFFGSIIITDYGADHNQGSYVLGQEGVYGEAINTDGLDYYGPWMDADNAYNEEDTEAPTEAALNSQASRNVSGRSPVPQEVRIPQNSTVRLSDSLRVNDLVPGAKVPLRATLNARSQSMLQKLDHVTVTENASGEEVKITLVPGTKADEDEEEE